MSIATVIITKNEEKNIARCIESVIIFSNEIIVVDDFSEDKTKDIATKYTKVRFYERKFDDYIRQKNYANSQVNCNYIFSIDADEYCDAELINFFKSNQYKSYPAISFLRVNYIDEKPISNGIWKRDYKVRCWQNGLAVWAGTIPHESLSFQKNIEVFKSNLIIHHLAYNTKQELYFKSKKYASLAALRLQTKSYLSLGSSLIINPLFKFFKGYFFLQGYKDGLWGWSVAKSSYLETFYKYFYALQLKWKK